MTKKELAKILAAHRKWIDGKGGCRADLSNADLQGANLNNDDLFEANLAGADLRGACLIGADLRRANLSGADLRKADISYADLRGAKLAEANFHGADLREANLRGADLQGVNLNSADLRGADLRWAGLRETDFSGADLDYSSWPLWCGSLNVKIDAKLAAQLMYHVVRACQSVTDDVDVREVCSNPAVLKLANKFHRIVECGKISAQKGSRKKTRKTEKK